MSCVNMQRALWPHVLGVGEAARVAPGVAVVHGAAPTEALRSSHGRTMSLSLTRALSFSLR